MAQELRNRLEKMTRSVLRHVERSVQVVASSSALALGARSRQPRSLGCQLRLTAVADREGAANRL